METDLDAVDRSIFNNLSLQIQSHAQSSAAAEHDKLTHSDSSGSLIITDCGGESSSKSTGTYDKDVPNPVPAGLKVIALLSMTTAIVLITASGILLSKTHDTLVKWLKAAPTTMPLLAQVNTLLGGTTGIVEEVESQEKYLKILITCSGVLVVTGLIQLLCNVWFFCRMNSHCIRRSLVKSEQFFFGL